MDFPVDLLFDLQDRMNELDNRRRARDEMPPEVAAIDEEFREKEKMVAELKEAVARERAEKEELDRQRAEIEERLAKSQAQLMNVRTNKEYSAALNEIDVARKESRSLDDRTLTVEAALEEHEKDLLAREEALPAERAEFEEKVADWRDFQKGCDAEIASLTAAIEELGTRIPRRLRSHFERLASHRGGVAVVRITDAFCAACNVRLRPALFQQLKLHSRTEIMTCESCQRILFFQDEEVASSAS